MTILETIIRELSSAPESLLLDVLKLIQSAKNHPISTWDSSSSPRIPNRHQGEIWISDDFNDPLPDQFWLDEDRIELLSILILILGWSLNRCLSTNKT